MSTMVISNLERILASGSAANLDSTSNPFEDSDGLISFVNLASASVTSSPQYPTGRTICDKVSNFFATLRPNVFIFLQKNPQDVPPGDTPPQTQWDPAVTHYMQNLLTEAGGFTNFSTTVETYSVTQNITSFSTNLIQILFDTLSAPTSIVDNALTFVQGIGQSLQLSWNNRTNDYQVALLGQCHEAVPVSPTDSSAFVYYPKIKYYYLSINSSQTAFTSNCANVQELTFDFQYESWVTGLQSAVLEPSSQTYQSFVAFLNQAQAVSYQQASNQLADVLAATSSSPGVEVENYPSAL